MLRKLWLADKIVTLGDKEKRFTWTLYKRYVISMARSIFNKYQVLLYADDYRLFLVIPWTWLLYLHFYSITTDDVYQNVQG